MSKTEQLLLPQRWLPDDHLPTSYPTTSWTWEITARYERDGVAGRRIIHG